jgi:hypothetical protein
MTPFPSPCTLSPIPGSLSSRSKRPVLDNAHLLIARKPVGMALASARDSDRPEAPSLAAGALGTEGAPIGLPRLRPRVDVRAGPVTIPSLPQIPQMLRNAAHVDMIQIRVTGILTGDCRSPVPDALWNDRRKINDSNMLRKSQKSGRRASLDSVRNFPMP